MDPCAIIVYLAGFDGHVEFRYLTDPEIPQACSATLDSRSDCFLPRFAARSDNFDHFVNAGPTFQIPNFLLRNEEQKMYRYRICG